jgi:hypothetical protein
MRGDENLVATAELFLSMTDVESRDLWLQTELEEFA